MLRLLPLLALLIVAAGCDSTETYPIGGDYVAVFAESQGTTTSTVSLPNAETGETFSFSVNVETVANGSVVESFSATGTGTYTYPDIELTVDGDTIDGTVSEDGTALTLDIEGEVTVYRLQEV